MLPIATVKLKAPLERSSPHPWVFWKAVEKPTERLPPGSLVNLVDPKDRWIGTGFYNGHARVRVRLLSTTQGEAVDEAFFAGRIAKAIEWREQTLKLSQKTDAYRLINSEGDDLSGLVVDRFGDCLVVEFFAAGMFRMREMVQKALSAHFPKAKFYSFAERHVQKQESFDCREEVPPAPTHIVEQGIKFRVAPGSLHKTGFFTDQRENRRALGEFSDGKRVLDLCCHTGGFSLYAAKAGAKEVTGLDQDPEALAIARANAEANGVKINFVGGDLYSWLREPKETFDVVVLDPAKQTRSREKLPEALRAYGTMNQLALKQVKPGGLFLTCSCSGLVKEDMFLEVLRQAASVAKRRVQIFNLTGAGGDHPYLVDVPEGRYLKAIWARVT
jgi:23S rRNA (cytosine1962-C5)-methyltransferase